MSASIQAARVSDFTQSIGVNTHLGYLGTPQANEPVVAAALAYLGVDHVRDVAPVSYMLPTYEELAANGVRFDLIATPYNTDIATALPGSIAEIDQLQIADPGSVSSIEGPNEVNAPGNNITYNGAAASSDPAVADEIMQAIYSAVHGDATLKGVLVLNLSVSGGEPGWQNYIAGMGNMSGYIDLNSGSVYPNQGGMPATWLQQYLPVEEQPAPGKPLVIREIGYSTNTLTTDPTGAVDLATQAKDTLDLLADAYKMGSQQTYIYQLLDDFNNPTPTSDVYGSCGLFYTDGTPKPAATAIHNLTSILADSGSTAQSFTPGTLNYSIPTLPADGNSLLLEKSSGAFDIMVWAEPNNWNPTTNTEISVPAVNTPVNLGATYQTVRVFDPLQGTSPIQTLNNVSSVNLSLTDHPLIVEVEPNSNLAIAPPVPCFCRGTHIATPDGEVPVERLRAGDLVTTLSGAQRRLRWVGFGRTLVTPRLRDHASVVVLRRDALAEGVPHRDLYVTHGHSFFFDGVLIPAAHLVNHRSIAWVEDARVVEYYHLELDSHDVILAEGAAAESYRDDDNSQHFHNVADRPAIRPLPSCAPVLHDDPIVRQVWRRLHERAGHLDVALTEDPDLHLLADGERLDAETIAQAGTQGAAVRVWRFRLRRPVSDLRIVSRSAIPAMVGTEPDQRRLGVALRRIVLAGPEAEQTIEWDDARLRAGFHAAEPLDRHRWTDGEAALPLALLAGLRGGALVELHVGGLLPYPVTEPSRHLPEGSLLRAGAEPGGTAEVVTAPVVELARAERVARMRRRGYGIVADPELRVLADDGAAIALRRFGGRLCLAVPAGARRLRLASRQATPAEFDRVNADPRRLGVAVAQVRLDGMVVPLDDARLLDGWHAPEPGFRWTDGAAVLDVTGIAVVELRLAAIPLPYVAPSPTDQPRQAAG